MNKDSLIEIHYETEEVIELSTTKLLNWITHCVSNEGFHLGFLEIILSNDQQLLRLNKDYLNHNYYTDIITFDYSEHDQLVSGGIYISFERVKENAQKFNVSETEELFRVIIHGVLHLIGYQDDSISNKEEMTAKENYYLSLLSRF